MRHSVEAEPLPERWGQGVGQNRQTGVFSAYTPYRRRAKIVSPCDNTAKSESQSLV